MYYNCRKRKFIKEKGCKYKELSTIELYTKKELYTKQRAELSNMVALFRL